LLRRRRKLPRVTLVLSVCVDRHGRGTPHAKALYAVGPILLIRVRQPFEARPSPGPVEHIADPSEVRAVVNDHITAIGIWRRKTYEDPGVSAGCRSNESRNGESSDHVRFTTRFGCRGRHRRKLRAKQRDIFAAPSARGAPLRAGSEASVQNAGDGFWSTGKTREHTRRRRIPNAGQEPAAKRVDITRKDGATVLAGVAGYGAHRGVHRKGAHRASARQAGRGDRHKQRSQATACCLQSSR
jgi:hypothetical protein